MRYSYIADTVEAIGYKIVNHRNMWYLADPTGSYIASSWSPSGLVKRRRELSAAYRLGIQEGLRQYEAQGAKAIEDVVKLAVKKE